MNGAFVCDEIEIWARACVRLDEACQWGHACLCVRACMHHCRQVRTSSCPPWLSGSHVPRTPPCVLSDDPLTPSDSHSSNSKRCSRRFSPGFAGRWRLSLPLFTENRSPRQKCVGSDTCNVEFAIWKRAWWFEYLVLFSLEELTLIRRSLVELSMDEKSPSLRSCCSSASLWCHNRHWCHWFCTSPTSMTTPPCRCLSCPSALLLTVIFPYLLFMHLCLTTVSKTTKFQKCLFGGNRSFIGFGWKVAVTSRQEVEGLLGNSRATHKITRKNYKKEKIFFLKWWK